LGATGKGKKRRKTLFHEALRRLCESQLIQRSLDSLSEGHSCDSSLPQLKNNGDVAGVLFELIPPDKKSKRRAKNRRSAYPALL